MNVTLNSPLDDFVRIQMASGDFRSPEEVVAAALHLLRERGDERNGDVREKIDTGWEQAKSGKLLTPAEVRADLDERKSAWKHERNIA